jgi:hypothetical protein
MFDPHTLTILSLGFVLGLRHALDADHLAALSTVLAERPTVQASTAIGFFWGLGHTLMLLCVGTLLLALNLTIPEPAGHAVRVCRRGDAGGPRPLAGTPDLPRAMAPPYA